MVNYYTVSYNNNDSTTTTTTTSDPSFSILQTRTKSIPLLSADGVSSAGKLVYFNGSVVKTSTDDIGNVRHEHNLYIYEGGVFVGTVSYLLCYENDEVKLINSSIYSNIVNASGKFIGSFGLPVFITVDNITGIRNITFQYN
jgi:hypothetical protein